MFGNIGKPKCDGISMWNRDVLWRRNSIGKVDEIPMWKIEYCGNAIKPKSIMKIPMWERDCFGNAVKSKEVMKFQWERDKYSTALNIQKPPLNP